MRKHQDWRLTLGARPERNGVWFRVWAPGVTSVGVITFPDENPHALETGGDGYHAGLVSGLAAGTRYMYRLDDTALYPDPASRSQPEGVHGASEVVDPDAFRWSDAAWAGTARSDLVIYELHIGTFTTGGSFDSAIEHLDAVARLGATAIEIMPIGEFAGSRNWGYDGVGLFAPASTYGGPYAFKRLVDAAHRRGLGVILDVVYNHLGPEGNYLGAVTAGRFFTDRHGTPWGDAVNFDGADSGPVRDFVIQNALHWAHEYHIDGLRLDATHAIVDESPVHILRELADALHAIERPRLVIAEDERDEPRLILPAVDGGYGLDAVWADDLHHQLRRLTAGDREGYFRRYRGTVDDVVATLRNGWYRDGAPPGVMRFPPSAFVHCIQNHDQVGNRAMGERLDQDIPLPVYRALSTLLLLSPYTPLLWMGQEWAASTPFQFFTDFPKELGQLVTEGRRNEFRAFAAFADPAVRDRIPDPQAEETFVRSRLRWEERSEAPHKGMLALYSELLAMRRTDPALRLRDRDHFSVTALGDRALALRRDSPDGDAILVVINLAGELRVGLEGRPATTPPKERRWTRSLWTEDERFGGPGSEVRFEPAELLVVPSPGAVVLCSGNLEGNAR
jgi:maltooligosyltrehalose trehalohydrolase